MKVLFVMHNNNRYSGANLAMQEVIKKLSSDIEYSVLYPNKGGSADAYFQELGVQTLYLKYWPLLLSDTDGKVKNLFKYPLLLYRQIRMKYSCRTLKSTIHKFDVIYSNSSSITIGLMLSKMYSIPHVWHVREFLDKDHGFLFPYGKRNYYKLANSVDGKIVAISKSLLNAIAPFVPQKNINLIYDDVDNSYINPDNLSLNDTKLRILIAGDIKRGKGQLEAVQALKILIDKGVDAELYIAGKTGDQQYLCKIKEYIHENAIDNSVIFLGPVMDMNQLRNKMNIGIVASYSEAFGRVTVEGMLSKMAMVGRNSGATVEILNDNQNGLLYNGSPDDLAEKITKLQDLYFRNIIAKQGFEFAKEKYTSGVCSQKVEALIKSCVDTKGV